MSKKRDPGLIFDEEYLLNLKCGSAERQRITEDRALTCAEQLKSSGAALYRFQLNCARVVKAAAMSAAEIAKLQLALQSERVMNAFSRARTKEPEEGDHE